MHEHRLGGERSQFREHPLGLAEGIGEQHAGDATLPVALPPGVNVVRHFGRGGPAVGRQREGRFADETVARHDFERCAGGVGGAFVVAGHDPDAPRVGNAHLRGAEHMTGRMQGHVGCAVAAALAVAQRVERTVRRQPQCGERPARCRHQVGGAARLQVIAVRVRDDRAGHGCPGIDVEAPGGAVEALGRGADQILVRRGSLPKPAAGARSGRRGSDASANRGAVSACDRRQADVRGSNRRAAAYPGRSSRTRAPAAP